ncbi:hypothetical protein GCM10009844_36000 [Nocardioides koreensis]|uniref:WD40 repeat domain-containing protein n=1 Tax=Nocardioides koreensis TaxID=433651 RepID=A0ABP5LRK4_9ACTN
MTERLSALLHDEASGLEIPPPSAPTVLARGRSLRRRRRAAGVAAALAVVAVVGSGAVLTTNVLRHDDRAVEPAGPSTGDGAVFAVGTTVFYDGGEHRTTIDDKAIKSMYFTSAGLLVRHGNNNFSDGGGPQRFSLVTPDGTEEPLSVVTEENVPGVDPRQPYLAYTTVERGTVHLLVHDVTTDENVADVTVPGDLTWGGWSGPPVALAGDTAYVGTDKVTYAVDWRTGEVATTTTVPPGYPDVQGGRAVTATRTRVAVVDVATGKTLLDLPRHGSGYLDLSPDGRSAMLFDVDDNSFEVYDVDTGSHVTIDGASYDYGWTPGGDLFTLRKHHVVTCSTSTAECATGSAEVPTEGGGVSPEDVRFAGRSYES